MLKKNRFFYVVVMFFLLVIGLLFFLLFRKQIFFGKIQSDSEIIEVNSDFVVENVSACYGNKLKCIDIDVSVVSDVDTSVLGEYTVKYTASYKNKSKVLEKKVYVVDRQSPEINVDSDFISACPNASEFNVNYSAYDNYDGDLSANVVKEIVDDSLILSVKDLSDNSYSKTISIKREDVESPVINLSGNGTMYVAINSNFSDPGFEAIDNCDGNITDKVLVEGSVNTSSPGTYYINYSVSDGVGNNSSVTRTVNVYAPNGNGAKVIYLTFDDGPSQYTGELLDILARYNVKATFFVTGINRNYSYYIKQAYDQGHSIALHTNSHNYSIVYQSVDSFFNDLNSVNELVKTQTGNYSSLIRFPGGSSNTVSRNYSSGIMSQLARIVEEKGYKYFDWNVSSGDASGTIMSSDVYANNVIRGLGNGSYYIVLQHDTNINSIRAVGTIIEYGLSHGYSFRALDMSSPTVHHRIAN